MHTKPSLSTLRALALSLASIAAGAAIAAQPVLIAKADTAIAPAVFRASVEAPAGIASYPSLAEAEMVGMGYADFDAVLAEALRTPTAAGHSMSTSRGLIEAVVAHTMGGLMP